MGLINKIDLNAIQANIRETVSRALDIRLLEEQLEDVINYIEANKKYLNNGKISKAIYEENKIKLEKNRKLLILKINRMIKNGVRSAKKAQDFIKVNKI